MTWATDWKLELNKRNNKEKIGAVVGTVLDRDNLKVGILNNNIILTNNNYYTTKYFDDLLKSFHTIDGNIVYEINKGDKVLVIATEDIQTYFIVDKLI